MRGNGDYISREAALELLSQPITMSMCLSVEECHHKIAQQCIDRYLVENIPAADVRPVVLCKDCKWCHAGYCEKYDDLIPFGCSNKPWEDWFCAEGAMLKK